MRSREYVFVLIASICFILALISFQNKCLVSGYVSTTETELDTILSLTDTHTKLTDLLERRIASLDALLQKYADENARLALENKALRDERDGFWSWMEQEYDFEGHNDLYERTH